VQARHHQLQQYYLADPNWAVKLLDEMAFTTAAPLMCAGSTIYNHILRAEQPKGSILAIVGLGGLGYLGVQFAKAMGYHVVAVDTRARPLELVGGLPKRFKPDLLLNPLEDDKETALRNIADTFPDATGVDATLVAMDAVAAFAWSKGIIAKHRTMVFIGQPHDDVPFHDSDFVSQDLTIRAGCLGQASVVQEMVDMVQKEGIEVHKTVYRLEEVEKLMSDNHSPGIKGKLVLEIEWIH
jgi:propanol-preferring alcohol dehydrogenase